MRRRSVAVVPALLRFVDLLLAEASQSLRRSPAALRQDGRALRFRVQAPCTKHMTWGHAARCGLGPLLRSASRETLDARPRLLHIQPRKPKP